MILETPNMNTNILLVFTGGTIGSQVTGSTVDTSGTMTWMRPICIGSTLLMTVARNFP